MKILIVSQYFWPENFSINSIAKYLVEQGHSVDVLTGIPNYPQGKAFDGYGLFKNLHQDHEGVKISRVWMKTRGTKGGDKRLILNYLSYAFNASIAMLGRTGKKYDATFVYEMSPITQAYPALFLRKLNRVPMCLYVGDLWPDTLFSHGLNGGKVKKILTKMCSSIYKKTDHIIAVNESFLEPINRYTNNSRPISYIPQAVEDLYKPVQSTGELRKELGIDEKDFVVMFAGNIGFAQAPKTIVEAANKTRDNARIHYVFIGDGTLRQECEEYCRDNNLCNVHFIGRKPQEAMPALIAEADAMLITLKNQSNYNLTLPGRTQAFMACGKPIICCANGETARVIRSAECGLIAEADNAEDLANRISECSMMSKEALIHMGSCGLEYSKRNYDKNTVFHNIEKTLEGIKYAE